jgi:hypothetical protein
VPRVAKLFNGAVKVLSSAMTEAPSHAPSLPRGASIALIAVMALLAGAGMAGWLDHGASIFLAMASDAWAYCF